jgi:hypothetical protein
MQYTNPFKQPGVWLKGNTHTHTRGSDGALTVPEVGAVYKKHGYDFVFLTDHWRRTAPPAGGNGAPLLIPAEELDFVMNGDVYHVVCLGLRKEWPRREFHAWSELKRLAQREKALLILGHPYWSGTRSEKFLSVDLFGGVEVFNSVCDVLNSKGYGCAAWDDLLDAGRRLTGLAADDMHGPHIAGRGWIMVKAKSCAPGPILSAIRRGCFYASQGPEIKDITVRGRKIEVTCSPVRRISFIANRWNGRVLEAGDSLLTQAAWEANKQFIYNRQITYVRVECVDQQGRTAWSNPVFF